MSRRPGRPAAAGRSFPARGWIAVALLAPSLAAAREPRYDHRDQQGPSVEAIFSRDVVWRGSSSSSNSLRGGLRVAYGFDPTGDGDEIFFGASLTTIGSTLSGEDRIRWTIDSRYRVTVGTDQFKTLIDLGIWGTGQDRLSVGPLVGIGFIYDFTREFGVLASAFLAAGAGQSAAVSFGGTAGIQYRFE